MLRTASPQRSDSRFEGHSASLSASQNCHSENDCNLDNDVQNPNKRGGLIVNRMALGLERSTRSQASIKNLPARKDLSWVASWLAVDPVSILLVAHSDCF
jgi:hypothetical protein